jgi:hypothetical protein
MADCWKPSASGTPDWTGDGCQSTNRWTPGVGSDAIACIAVACLSVACMPQETVPWEDFGGNALVCGEGGTTWPPTIPDQPDQPPIVVERAFSSGFSGGFE